jgi:hypothetical protein
VVAEQAVWSQEMLLLSTMQLYVILSETGLLKRMRAKQRLQR